MSPEFQLFLLNFLTFHPNILTFTTKSHLNMGKKILQSQILFFMCLTGGNTLHTYFFFLNFDLFPYDFDYFFLLNLDLTVSKIWLKSEKWLFFLNILTFHPKILTFTTKFHLNMGKKKNLQSQILFLMFLTGGNGLPYKKVSKISSRNFYFITSDFDSFSQILAFPLIILTFFLLNCWFNYPEILIYIRNLTVFFFILTFLLSILAFTTKTH